MTNSRRRRKQVARKYRRLFRQPWFFTRAVSYFGRIDEIPFYDCGAALGYVAFAHSTWYADLRAPVGAVDA